MPVKEVYMDTHPRCRPPLTTLDWEVPQPRRACKVNPIRLRLSCVRESPTYLPGQQCAVYGGGLQATPLPGLIHSLGTTSSASWRPGRWVPLPSSVAFRPPSNGIRPRSRGGISSQFSSRVFFGSPPCLTTQWGCQNTPSSNKGQWTQTGHRVVKYLYLSLKPASMSPNHAHGWMVMFHPGEEASGTLGSIH